MTRSSSAGLDFEAIGESRLARSGRRVGGGVDWRLRGARHDRPHVRWRKAREGVGFVNGQKQGFLAHLFLAVAAEPAEGPGLQAGAVMVRD